MHTGMMGSDALDVGVETRSSVVVISAPAGKATAESVMQSGMRGTGAPASFFAAGDVVKTGCSIS